MGPVPSVEKSYLFRPCPLPSDWLHPYWGFREIEPRCLEMKHTFSITPQLYIARLECMMMSLSSSLLAFGLSLFVCQSAQAGNYSEACSKAGKDAQESCKAAVAATKKADQSSADSKISSVGSQSTIHPGGGAQGSQIADQMARLKSTKSTCESAKAECKKTCEEKKSAAQSDTNAAAQGEPAQVDQKKKDDCLSPLEAMIQELDAGLGNLTQDQKSNSNSQNGSNSMPQMPMMPSQSQGDDSSSKTPSSTASTNTTSSSTDSTPKALSTGSADFSPESTSSGNSASSTREGSTSSYQPSSTTSSSSPTSTSATASRGGSGSAASGSSGSQAALSPLENLPNVVGNELPNLSTDIAGGGGGGSSGYGGGGFGEGELDSEKGSKSSAAAPQSLGLPTASDISKPKYSPSLFSISSQVTRTWCSKKGINSCRGP